MIIRLSNNNDVKQIISLWNEAFGDSENEIRFFLDNNFIPENTLIAEENGRIASMLFLLEGNMKINNSHYPSFYLYAACTANDYRGRGYMSCMLKDAKRTALSRNKDFICLLPGENSLFEFYKKHGYKTVFSKKVLTINRNDFKKNFVIENVDRVNFEELRNNAFFPFDYFEWSNESIEFAAEHTEFYSGKRLTSRKGYCLYSENGHEATVKEFAFAEENFEYGISLLFSSCTSEIIKVNLPSNYKTKSEEYEIFSSGMICPVSIRSESIVKNLYNAYLGLTLD